MSRNTKILIGVFIGFIVTCLLSICCIIVLSGSLTVAGVDVAKRNSRDAERRAILQDINVALVMYNVENNDYPSGDLEGFDLINGVIRDQSVDANTTEEVEVFLKRMAYETTETSTAYCYKRVTSSSYLLGVQLETDGEWYELSTASSGSCSSDDVVTSPIF